MPFTANDPPIVLQSTSLELVATFEQHNAFFFLAGQSVTTARRTG